MKTACKKPSGRSKPEVLVLDMTDLDETLARIRAAGVSEPDCAKMKALADTVAWLHQELDDKTLTISRLRSLFGLSKSEKTRAVVGGSEDGSDDKPKDKDVGGEGTAPADKGKRKGHGRNAASSYVGGKQVQVAHGSLEHGDPCPACPETKRGKVYVQKQPSRIVRVTGQAPLQATVYELERLRCNLCGEVFVAEPPPGIGDKRYDAKSVSMIALLKYGSGMPFNRLEQLQGSVGIPLPTATQWDIVSAAAEEIAPAYTELIRQAAQGRLIHNDDTSMRVLELRKQIDELEQAGETDRTGIFSSGIVSELAGGQRVALFFTGRQHAGENIADLLAQRAAELDAPMQMCDGLDRNLPKELETVLANCLVHARRQFVGIVESFPDECRHVLETLRDVYGNDAVARERGMSAEERLRYHGENSAPLMAGLREWMRERIEQKLVEPNSALGKAIRYMTKRWERLTLFLREPGAPLDNNVVERALKKAVLHRKNALFYKTENGARVGDLFMALIHTAELAQANPLEYLTALLEHVDDVKRDPGPWLPWSYKAALGEKGPPASRV